VTTLQPSYRPSASIGLIQPILKGFGKTAQESDVMLATNAEEMAGLNLRVEAMKLALDVEKLYWKIAIALDTHRISQKAMKNAEERLQLLIEKQRRGEVSEIEVLEGNFRKTSAREKQIEALHSLRDLQTQFLDLLGVEDLAEGVEIIPLDDLVFKPYPIDIIKAHKRALGKRPDYRQILLQIENKKICRDKAHNDTLPDLNIFGTFTMRGLENDFWDGTETLGDGHYYDWAVGISLEFPIWNRSARGNLKKTELELAQAEIMKRRLRSTIFSQLRRAAQAVRATRDYLRATKAKTALAVNRLRIERARRKQGLITSQEISEVELMLEEARANEKKALVEYEMSCRYFELAKGTILDQYDISYPK
jgi:outer membrane protein TolC